MQVQTYLFFDGRCEEALNFYREKLGAELTSIMRFKEMPNADEGAITPDNENKIMHASVRLGNTTLLASDGMANGDPKFEGFCINLTVESDDEARRVFDLLADGGNVKMPVTPMFFASSFGLVNDKFGVSWMVLAGVKA